ncbi:hypothetical protein [Breoghania sp. L-A4]|uniref:phage head-tail joining protein n=1 Tax=Breoghania sp. L-A4 TaxID=2304600 RepID=UPI000E35C9F9|nr:hypothetical protein [Breoghania sp. L-A4]AXS39233.1 hypothetical protein D1F64_03180 [Breoghania sp. L-A4]
MAETLEGLQARLEKLHVARDSGTHSVRFGEEEVRYRTDTELASAIAALERRITALQGRKPVRTVYINSTKGL